MRPPPRARRPAHDAGAELEQPDSFGFTPLLNALLADRHCVDADDEDILVRLLDAGADPGHRDDGGVTAAQYAQVLGRQALADKLRRRADRARGRA